MKLAKDISELLDILYPACNLFGIFPLTRRRVRNKYVYEATPINLRIILPTISMVCSMTLGALYIVAEIMQDQNKRLFDNITNMYVLLVDPYLSGTITLVTMLMRRKAFLRLLKLLHNIDHQFKVINATPPYGILTGLAWSFAIVIPVGISSWAIHMYLIQDDILTHLLWRLCFTPCYIMYNYFMCVYVGILILLYQRLRLLNKTINSINSRQFHVVSKLLPSVSLLHFHLCEASNRITKHVDLPILMLTLKVYITTIACVLSFYGMVPQMHSELTVWMAVYWCYFLACVGFCELIKNEFTKTGPLLCEMTATFYENKAGDKRNTFLLQILVHKMDFSVFGIQFLSVATTVKAAADMLSILSFLLYLRNESE